MKAAARRVGARRLAKNHRRSSTRLSRHGRYSGKSGSRRYSLPVSSQPLDYGLHSSTELRALLAARPFQGAEPSSARFIFFGLDANFAANVESDTSFFAHISAYLKDGVQFWQSEKKHHPFLLRSYSGSGRKYHEKFEEIGFKPEHAAQVAFVEVLHIPTYGSGYPSRSWLASDHLARLENWVESGAAQYVFIPPSVIPLLKYKKFGRFQWLPSDPVSQWRSLPILYRSARTTIFKPYHFSYRYVPPGVLQQQRKDIGALIDGA
jgi:hypothetical protein